MSTVEVTGLNVIAAYVTDLAKSEEFYREHLGFLKLQDMPPGILMTAGDVTLYLEAGREKEKPAGSIASEYSPCFKTASVKESYGALKSSGVDIAEDYVEFGPEFALFRISDPDGNLIEFAGKP